MVYLSSPVKGSLQVQVGNWACPLHAPVIDVAAGCNVRVLGDDGVSPTSHDCTKEHGGCRASLKKAGIRKDSVWMHAAVYFNPSLLNGVKSHKQVAELVGGTEKAPNVNGLTRAALFRVLQPAARAWNIM